VSLADNFKELSHDLISSQKHRSKYLRHLEEHIEELLERFQRERISETESISVLLVEDRARRLNRLRKMLDSFEDDRRESEKIWNRTMKKINEIRKEYSQPRNA
jgi:septal ring factor EnvC (AmiA/AmiB activator)